MTTNKTTTTPAPLTDRLEAAETAHTAAVTERHEKAEALARALPQARTDLEAAEDAHADVRSALARGDETTVPSDLSRTGEVVDAARLRVEHLEMQERRAKAPLNTQIEAALGTVPVVNAVLPRVPVYVTAGPVPELTEADAPFAVLRQIESTATKDGSQRTEGASLLRSVARPGVKVELHYLRSVIHRQIDWRELAESVRKADLRVQIGTFGGTTTDLGNGLCLDKFTLTSGEVPAVPVVEEVGQADKFASTAGRAIADHLRYRAHVASTATTLGSTEVDGIRTTTVTGTTELREVGTPGRGASESIGNPRDLEGEMFAGLGRCTRLQVQSRGIEASDWTAAFTSRVSHETPHPADETATDAA